MTFPWSAPLPDPLLTAARLIGAFEGFNPTINMDDTHPTIGNGFNIGSDAALQDRIFLGPWGMDATADAATIARLRSLLKTYDGRPSSSRGELQAALDAVMAGRAAARPGTGPASFTITEADSHAVLAAILRDVYAPRVDAWLPGIPGCREKVVLLSLCYNAVLTGSPSLHAALLAGDRASAWFEIRYRSNGGGERNGIAKRRYAEAEVFGLYGDASAPTAAETAQVSALLAAHKATMEAYDAQFAPEIAAANADPAYRAGLGDYGPVQTLAQCLGPATALA
ncbi:hypothetical protein ACM64Y_07270 [Novispirillum sp. DQ9]|uniref:hypothetical protein n=1 Tax=Novispirillum sp. DQ9 TaxID=3398612 RepID=UPI003C7A7C22